MIAYTEYSKDGRVRLEAESLVKWGYEVTFLAGQEEDKPRTYMSEGVTVKEVGVRIYGDKNVMSYLYSYLNFMTRAFFACTQLFFRSGIRVIHVHNMPNMLVFTAIIPRLFGCKVVLDVHDTVPETYIAKFSKPSRLMRHILHLEESMSFALAHKLVCVNDVQYDTLIQRGIPPDKITTIVTMPKYLNANSSTDHNGSQSRAFRIVNHGTVSKRLGIDLIVKASAKLAQEIPNFEFHLYGQGDDLRNVLNLIKTLGVTNAVHFHGVIPWTSIPKELENMDVGILGNRRNVATELMLPLKLIDYVSLGLPAVVPRLKTIEYYFSEDMVTFYEPEDVDSMVQAVLSLYKDRQGMERQAQNAKSFLDRCSWENNQKGLKSLYDDLFKDWAA